MSVEVVMPQMGESITEGTVSKWHKKVGDRIERDELLLDISTDKIDAEIPAPAAGTLLEIRTNEGETVEVGAIVALIGEESEAGAPASNGASSPAAAAEKELDTPKTVTSPVEAGAPEIETPQVKAVAVTETPVDVVSAANSADSGDAVEVVMPQMGESITEGTVSKWYKKVGDRIERDEQLLEISTDKVDAEIPAPAGGILLEIRTNEGETVEVGAIVGLIGSAAGVGNAGSKAEKKVASALMPKPETAVTKAEEQQKAQVAEVGGRSYDYQRPGAIEDAQAATVPATNGGGTNGDTNGGSSVEDLRRTKSSPLVRKIAAEHGVDISRLAGSGISGRVTKNDILSFLDSGAALKPEDLLVKSSANAPSPASLLKPESRVPQVSSAPQMSAPVVPQSAGDKIEPMSNMRKRIAEHMVSSKRTSAHVTSVYEIDMTNVVKFREKNRTDFLARYGTKLTYMPFIFQAVTQSLRKFPIVNSQVDGDKIIYKGDVNLGMAVALDWGLIVPVIKRADQLSLSGLALAANDLADRARTKKLLPDEVQGGTFTITNPGVFGGLIGTPIINQPQVAILYVGAIEKRAKVITTAEGDDVIAIRSMAFFALTYDHRVVDGADAEKFLSFLKMTLETTQFAV